MSESPLRKFLAESDARCPSCSYELRGLTCESCPECGTALRLQLARPDGPRRGPILLALLAWVLLACAMGGYRAWRDALSESTVGQRLVVQVGTPGVTRRFNLTPGQPVTIRGGVTLGSAGTTIAAQRLTLTPAPRSVSLNRVPVAAGPARNWSVVEWQTWARLGWWGALSVIAVSGFACWLVASRRGRPAPDAVAWIAGAGFGLYACSQVVGFIRDFA